MTHRKSAPLLVFFSVFHEMRMWKINGKRPAALMFGKIQSGGAWVIEEGRVGEDVFIRC